MPARPESSSVPRSAWTTRGVCGCSESVSCRSFASCDDSSEMTRPAKPLDGIRVLAFEVQVAGPYCTMMLADQGADVVKVERPEGGDTARGGAPHIENDKGEVQSGYFLRFNRNKRSLTLNLKSEEGRRLFAELAEKSDVVVENFRPGLLDDMGIGYKALSQRNPRLIYACISGFG